MDETSVNEDLWPIVLDYVQACEGLEGLESAAHEEIPAVD